MDLKHTSSLHFIYTRICFDFTNKRRLKISNTATSSLQNCVKNRQVKKNRFTSKTFFHDFENKIHAVNLDLLMISQLYLKKVMILGKTETLFVFLYFHDNLI